MIIYLLLVRLNWRSAQKARKTDVNLLRFLPPPLPLPSLPGESTNFTGQRVAIYFILFIFIFSSRLRVFIGALRVTARHVS